MADLMRHASALDEVEAAKARGRFLERFEQESLRERRPSVAYWVAPLSLAATFILAYFFWPASTLTYEVAGATEDGGYIQAVTAAPAVLTFTDATSVRAEPGARLRVVETKPNGARVSLEEGRLAVHVIHTTSSAWNFVAGPFDVQVTGTRFDLSWDPELERLHVDLFEGSVQIASYDGSGPLPLLAGQRFLGDAQRRTMQVSRLGSGTSSELSVEAGADARAANDSTPSEEDSAAAVEAPKSVGTSVSVAWSGLVSKGKFRDVVEAAEARGVSSCLSSCSAADLDALADAARYTGKNALAEQSLKALRSRFQSSSGPRAAFLLGRLAEGQGQMASAKTWYDTALGESPAGAYAGEALAGRMRVVLSMQGRAAAFPIAREYLKRYPEGVHAEAAKKIAQP